MSSCSERGAVYRGMVEDVIAGGLLSDEERAELQDLLRRVQRKMAASLPADQDREVV